MTRWSHFRWGSDLFPLFEFMHKYILCTKLYFLSLLASWVYGSVSKVRRRGTWSFCSQPLKSVACTAPSEFCTVPSVVSVLDRIWHRKYAEWFSVKPNQKLFYSRRLTYFSGELALNQVRNLVVRVKKVSDIGSTGETSNFLVVVYQRLCLLKVFGPNFE